MGEWYVYLLRCRDGTLYCGVTTDWRRRLREHGTRRGARYTRAHPPQGLAALWLAPDKPAALRLEYRLKQLPAAQKQTLTADPARLSALLPALAATPYRALAPDAEASTAAP